MKVTLKWEEEMTRNTSTKTGLFVTTCIYKLECIVNTLYENEVIKSTHYLIHFIITEIMFPRTSRYYK